MQKDLIALTDTATGMQDLIEVRLPVMHIRQVRFQMWTEIWVSSPYLWIKGCNALGWCFWSEQRFKSIHTANTKSPTNSLPAFFWWVMEATHTFVNAVTQEQSDKYIFKFIQYLYLLNISDEFKSQWSQPQSQGQISWKSCAIATMFIPQYRLNGG